MAWYKTGTVTITNGATSVTGTGTQFATNARVGDALRGPDGAWYEVTNIASETVLAISPGYIGASVTNNANYRIAPMQGYVKESADRLRALIDSLGYTDSPRLKSIAQAVTAVNSILIADTASTMTSLATGANGRLLLVGADAAANRNNLGATAIGNSLFTAIDTAAGRSALALGTAATQNIQTSNYDITSGAVMRVGAFGLGAGAPTVTDANAITGSGFFSLATTASGGVNGPSQIASVGWYILNVNISTTYAHGWQIASPATSVTANKYRLFHRQQFNAGLWSDWKEFADTDSPSFTGTPSAPTAALGTNTTQLATMAAIFNSMSSVGAAEADMPQATDLNSVSTLSGFFRWNNTSLNIPVSGAFGSVLQIRYSLAYTTQLASVYSAGASQGKMFWRINFNGTWQAWKECVSVEDTGMGAVRAGESGFYSKLPSAPNNVTGTAFVAANGTDDQATAHQPVAGEAFAGISMSRQLRPVQVGVSGSGAAAKLYFRGYSGSTSVLTDWKQAVSTTDLAAATTGLGLGAIAPAITDLNSPTTTQFARFANSATNTPIAASGLLMHTQYAATYASQLVITVQSNDATLYNRTFTRTLNSGTWGAWRELTATDTLAALGITTTAAPLVTAIDSIRSTGTYYCEAAVANASGLPVAVGHTITHIAGVSAASGHAQWAHPATSVSTNRNRVWHRQNWSSGWSAWQEVTYMTSIIGDYLLGANTAVSSSDTLMAALGKLQGQVNARYQASNIVGTVGQSGGVPTGAIMEIGSNANGTYRRYADGTQICTFAVAGNVTTSNVTGSLFYSGAVSWTFPVAFVSDPAVSCDVSAPSAVIWSSGVGSGTSSTQTQHYIVNAANQTVGVTRRYIAIGRWF